MRQPDILYVNFNTDGNAARVLKTPEKKTPRLPKARKAKRHIVYIDPVATIALVVAVWMMVLMVSGVVRFQAAQKEHQVMESYVQQLSQENAQLRAEFTEGYDLEKIEKMAVALGMVPKENVTTSRIMMSAPETQENESFWERIGTFLAGLFA